MQQLADLCCLSHFAAVCTTFTLHCAVALLIGNIHLIYLCESQNNVVSWFLLLETSNNNNNNTLIIDLHNHYVSRHRPFEPILLSLQFHLVSLCLILQHAVTDVEIRYVFLHPLYVFSPVTFFISKFIHTSKFIYLLSEDFHFWSLSLCDFLFLLKESSFTN